MNPSVGDRLPALRQPGNHEISHELGGIYGRRQEFVMSGRLVGPGGFSLSSFTTRTACTGASPGAVNELRARGALMYIKAMAVDLPSTNSETISAAYPSRCTITRLATPQGHHQSPRTL
jgi:hypothetical protein